ncbi:MAG: hypothetical protein Q8P30_02850 [Candidatus Uhrbacteria bacterium]|nr:hypothetical protein [Candidatus Uhrbacteria bacterium]
MKTYSGGIPPRAGLEYRPILNFEDSTCGVYTKQPIASIDAQGTTLRVAQKVQLNLSTKDFDRYGLPC